MLRHRVLFDFRWSICFPGKEKQRKGRDLAAHQSESHYTLHIQLVRIEPLIWSRVVVPGAISLHTLHKMLQVVMGWENTHLYVFHLNVYNKPVTYGLPDPDGDQVDMPSFWRHGTIQSIQSTGRCASGWESLMTRNYFLCSRRIRPWRIWNEKKPGGRTIRHATVSHPFVKFVC